MSESLEDFRTRMHQCAADFDQLTRWYWEEKNTVTQLKARVDGLEEDLTEEIKERDQMHNIADKLAARIAELEGLEIGEHSSGNCPWTNAINGESAESY